MKPHTSDIFRELTPEETLEFQAWAQKNYLPFQFRSAVWHPVVIAECDKIDEEQSLYRKWNAGLPGYNGYGSFQTSILEAYRLADSGNRRRLEIAWPEWFLGLNGQVRNLNLI